MVLLTTTVQRVPSVTLLSYTLKDDDDKIIDFITTSVNNQHDQQLHITCFRRWTTSSNPNKTRLLNESRIERSKWRSSSDIKGYKAWPPKLDVGGCKAWPPFDHDIIGVSTRNPFDHVRFLLSSIYSVSINILKIVSAIITTSQ